MVARGDIGVLLVSEDQLERAGLHAVLGRDSGILIVGDAESPGEAHRVASLCKPDVILCSERSLSRETLVLAERLAAQSSDARPVHLIVLVPSPDDQAINLLRIGRCTLLGRGVSPSDLIAAVRVTAAGYMPIRTDLARNLAAASVSLKGSSHETLERVRSLTKRERRVFELMIQGLSNPEIAVGLGVAESTVKSHVQSILGKLDLRDRVQAVIFAYEAGIVRRAAPLGEQRMGMSVA
ncbi:LuxR C-terminal-related transcriptional regulator [Streptomyces sp. NPDC057638]|uniref:LuxR C-terminal-related transcriptional regulator n=1 Tax=Streptomyces sp. NPDC057638 TaxID=3346190 RepID=UPI0036C78AED